MNHSDKTDILTSGIKEPVHKEAIRVNIIHANTLAVSERFPAHTLNHAS